MEHLAGIIWYSSWPVVVYLSFKFVQLNLNHFNKMERLEELEAKYSKIKVSDK